jgi:hypothetical protein
MLYKNFGRPSSSSSPHTTRKPIKSLALSKRVSGPNVHAPAPLLNIGLYIDDAHVFKHYILLCYLDFEGAFPSTDHIQFNSVVRYLTPPKTSSLLSPTYTGEQPPASSPHTDLPHKFRSSAEHSKETLSLPFFSTYRWSASSDG